MRGIIQRSWPGLREKLVLLVAAVFYAVAIGRNEMVSAATTATGTANGDAFWDVEIFTDKVRRLSPIDTGYDEADFYYPIRIYDGNSNNGSNDVDISSSKQRNSPPIVDVESTNTEIFPLVVFLQGVDVDKSEYSYFLTDLASHGYVVVATNHQPSKYGGKVMASQWTPTDVLNDVIVRSSIDRSSPLFGIVDTEHAGMCGHSNGGAAALFASSMACQPPFCFGPPDSYMMPVEYRAVVGHGTHTVPMGGIYGDLEPLDVNNTIPVAIIQGEHDALEHVCASWPLIEEQKDIVVLAGANHWSLTNIQYPNLQSRYDGPVEEQQTIPQSTSISLAAEWTAIVFDAYLKQDKTSIQTLEQNKYENGVYLNQHCVDDDDVDDGDDDDGGGALRIYISLSLVWSINLILLLLFMFI